MANKGLAKSAENMTILVTGGAGFIGSHTCVELLDEGYYVVILDDLSNSSPKAIERVRTIATGTTSLAHLSCAMSRALTA